MGVNLGVELTVGVGVAVVVALAVGVAVTVAVAVGVVVAVDVAVAVGMGEVVGVGVGLPEAAQYLPPVFNETPKACPPQAIISLPVQTAVRYLRPGGALMLLVALQLSVPGSYLPPAIRGHGDTAATPDNHFTARPYRRELRSLFRHAGHARSCPTIGAWIVSSAGVQQAAVISTPDDHFASCIGPYRRVPMRPAGAFVVVVAVQLSVQRLYFPPVLK